MAPSYKKHVFANTRKLVYGFVRGNEKRLKLVNIPRVVIELFILFINQIDTFINPRYGFTIINNYQTVMRNDVDAHSFKEVYGSQLIQLKETMAHSWKVAINSIPFYSDKCQLTLGICDKELDFDDEPLSRYHYYGMDDKFNHSYRSFNNRVMIQHENIDNFQGKRIAKYDVITIEVIKWYRRINLNFYVNDIHCVTYFKLENIPYRLFISTNTMFASCSLKQYESSILTE